MLEILGRAHHGGGDLVQRRPALEPGGPVEPHPIGSSAEQSTEGLVESVGAVLDALGDGQGYLSGRPAVVELRRPAREARGIDRRCRRSAYRCSGSLRRNGEQGPVLKGLNAERRTAAWQEGGQAICVSCNPLPEPRSRDIKAPPSRMQERAGVPSSTASYTRVSWCAACQPRAKLCGRAWLCGRLTSSGPCVGIREPGAPPVQETSDGLHLEERAGRCQEHFSTYADFSYFLFLVGERPNRDIGDSFVGYTWSGGVLPGNKEAHTSLTRQRSPSLARQACVRRALR